MTSVRGRDAEPHVSIGLLVHDAQETLRESIDSVLAQVFTNFDLLLSDDGSSDHSLKICEEYAARDPRIRVQHHKSNIGGIANFNSVVAAAPGPYFVWFSDHDTWDPEYLQTCVRELEQNPSAVLCYAGSSTIDGSGDVVGAIEQRLDTRGRDQLTRFAITLWSIAADTSCIYGVLRLDALRRIPRFPRLYPSVVGPDVVLLMELSLLGEFLRVDRSLYFLRAGPPGHGGTEQYLRRLRITPRSRLHGALLFARMARQGSAAVKEHVPRPRKRVQALLLLGMSLGTSYRWLLRDLVALGGRNRPRPWRSSR